MSTDKTKVCHELTILERIQETEDTVSLVLDVPRTPGAKFNYRAGQFVTFFMDINGEEIRRSYSLASSPDYDRHFKVTIKLVPGGKGSTYLTQNAKVGQKLWTTPPAGHFCLPLECKKQKIGLFAAGSGITPIISIIKSALKQDSQNECFLFYQSRFDNQIIFQKELDKLEKEFSPRLKIVNIISRPSASWQGLSGRVDATKIKDFLTRHSLGIQTLHYICGPNEFMNVIENTLLELHVDKKNLHKEAFSVSTHAAPESSQSSTSTGTGQSFTLDEGVILIGDKSALSAPSTIEAIIDGETHTVKYNKDSETVLDCLLRADLSPPYSCLDGACMACIAKIKEGLVYQKDMGILSDDNIDAGECLTCQARPASTNVKIHYETF